jgi:hypothetical protein
MYTFNMAQWLRRIKPRSRLVFDPRLRYIYLSKYQQVRLKIFNKCHIVPI